MTHRGVTSLAFGALLWAPLLVLPAKASEWDKMTIVKFNQPVEIPNHVLPAGEYVMKLIDADGERDIVQFYTKDEKKLVATVIGISDYRMEPTDKTVITFERRSDTAPEAIKSWFYPGEDYGIDFVYPPVHAMHVTENTPPAASSPSSASIQAPALAPAPPAEQKTDLPLLSMNQPDAAMEAPESAPAPAAAATEPQPAPDPPATAKELPHTASDLPVSALLGTFSLGLGAGARAFHRHSSE